MILLSIGFSAFRFINQKRLLWAPCCGVHIGSVLREGPHGELPPIAPANKKGDRFGPRSRLSMEGESTSGSCNNRFVRGAGENGKPWLSHWWLPQCPSHKSRLLALVYLLTTRGSTPAVQYGKALGEFMQPQYLSSPGPTRTRPPGIETPLELSSELF